ncbi:hypothetical protein L1887_38501 [Cichorium endivia]|nr:hypothetical protein L1887_38501 [Cichorium endivia]
MDFCFVVCFPGWWEMERVESSTVAAAKMYSTQMAVAAGSSFVDRSDRNRDLDPVLDHATPSPAVVIRLVRLSASTSPAILLVGWLLLLTAITSVGGGLCVQGRLVVGCIGSGNKAGGGI